MPGHSGIATFGSHSRYDVTDERAWVGITCGHCGVLVNAAVIATTEDGRSAAAWLRCTNCHRGLVVDGDAIYPSALAGEDVEGLPDDVHAAYEEARRCFSVGGYTACDLVCRKLLMHVAVEKGADEGKKFVQYLDHLESGGFITPAMKGWVDLIREHGNRATHELPPSDRDQAKGTLAFTGQMLRIIYEMEHKAKQFTTAPQESADQ